MTLDTLDARSVHDHTEWSDPGPFVPATRHQVLVVDDDPAFAHAVADALVDRDIETVATSDPREALSLGRRRRFAAAIVDLIMPDMDGLELARELHRASPSTEVVMLTGHADMRSAIEGIRNEVFDYLQKDSLQSTRLRRAVRAAIARSEHEMENRRLVAGLTETTQRLRVLTELSARLAGEQHLDRLFAELVRAARELTGAEAVRAVMGERGDLGDVTLRAAYGDGEVAVGGHFGPGDGITAQVLGTGEPMRVDVPADHPSYSSRCDDMGTVLPGFLCVPLARPTVLGALAVAGRPRAFSSEELSLLASLAQQGAVAIENAMAGERSRNFFTHTSDMLGSLLDAQDLRSRGHGRAVAAITDMITRRLGLPEEDRRALHFAALLHDVGKLRLPPGLLAEGRLLSAEEIAQFRTHPTLGVELLRPISSWGPLLPAIHSHHERWDGKGYPRGLGGAEIPLGGRIIAVAEAFEAMTRTTPSAGASSADEALAEVEACSGTQFDPVIARLFVEEYRLNRDRLADSRG
jgi:response regulator RpfG family c-di-GMP phosphodiesterase